MRDRRVIWRRVLAAALIAAAPVGVATPAQGGHELPYLPSYYPQEIRLEVVSADAAARALREGSLHVFVGGDPFAGRALPADLGAVESLRGYLIADLRGAAAPGADERCPLARRLTAWAANAGARSGGFVFHPYPVTPYHADYLVHADRVTALTRAAASALNATAPGNLNVPVEEVPVESLLASSAIRLDGSWAAPWLKEGWFNAFALLADRVRDPATRREAQALFARLAAGARNEVEQANLSRDLVAALTRTCEVAVLGYTTRREVFNAEFSKGVENVAFDSHTGLDSAVFVRTVKLKDFIWNGWLRVGVSDRPAAAWNPVAGFTDAFGRLLWAAVGDPALLPAPYGAGWVPNRVLPAVRRDEGAFARLRAWVNDRLGRGGTVPVPEDALLPEPGTGRLRPVGPGRVARARITFTVLTSSYHDGTRMDVADVLYPYVFAAVWGAPASGDAAVHDPLIERATAPLRDRLAGVKIVRIDHEVRTLGDLKLSWDNPVVDVYLNTGAGDPLVLAPIAAPWASIPWHVGALMEEAVRRRIATFSDVEARRAGAEWLDLVRRPAQTARLVALIDEFERQASVPEPLRPYVSPDDARARWRALKDFSRRYGHLLVTNGPYRLEKWTEAAAVLAVFRDLTYPRGAGVFDRYPIPHRAHLTAVTVSGGRLRVAADVERVEKFQRSYQIVRRPLTDAMLVGALRAAPVCRYVLIDADGRVLAAGTIPYAGGGAFAVDLRAPPGSTAAVAIALDENFMTPDVRMTPASP